MFLARKKGAVTLYALSTCVWCGKTKALLNKLGVAYDFEDVDLLTGGKRDRAVAEITRWNPGVSFPTLVFETARRSSALTRPFRSLSLPRLSC